jgi:hypothetical protein
VTEVHSVHPSLGPGCRDFRTQRAVLVPSGASLVPVSFESQTGPCTCWKRCRSRRRHPRMDRLEGRGGLESLHTDCRPTPVFPPVLPPFTPPSGLYRGSIGVGSSAPGTTGASGVFRSDGLLPMRRTFQIGASLQDPPDDDLLARVRVGSSNRDQETVRKFAT